MSDNQPRSPRSKAPARTEIASRTESEGRKPAPLFVLTKGGTRVELVAQARSDGRENLPESGAREPNEIETAIWREHERQHIELVEQTRNGLRELSMRFDALEDHLPGHQDVLASIAESLAEIETDLATDHTVVSLRQEQQLRRRDLRAFVREHRLVREANYPASRMLHFGIVALVVVGESLGNAEFFAPVSALGLVGGFLQAVGVSLVNVVSGVLTGFFCLRGLNHSNRHLRVLAGAGAIAYAFFALGFNLAVAHYRDLAATIGVNVHASLYRLLGSPLDLSLPSAALFAIGLIASLLALWKGFRLDDVVPGYGERHRRFVGAGQDLEQSTNGLRRQVLGRVEAVPELCRAVVRRASEDVQQMHLTKVRAQRALEAYEAQRAHLEDRCEVFLRRYRDENRAVRTKPGPAYFDTFPTFPQAIDCTPVTEMVERLGRAADLLDELKAEEHRSRGGQAARVQYAAARFEACLAERLHQADAGRGDGSEHSIGSGSDSPGDVS